MTPDVLQLRHRLEEEIPPFRQVAVHLLHLAGDPTVSMGRIVQLLETDPSLVMGLLRVANSPLFAPRTEITGIRQAVTYLGLDLVRSLAVTAAMRGLVDTRTNPLASTFWRHSLATALVCKRAAAQARVPPEHAYTAGLLHDVGQLGLLRLFPDYAQAVGAAVKGGESLVEAELRLYGMDHCQAGRWMFSRWRLPLELQSVAAGHETPPEKQTCDRDLIVLVHAGSLTADFMGLTVISPGLELTLEDLADAFAVESRQSLLEGLPALVEWVLMNVNAIEMSLYS